MVIVPTVMTTVAARARLTDNFPAPNPNCPIAVLTADRDVWRSFNPHRQNMHRKDGCS
jgi:hypothetical protein